MANKKKNYWYVLVLTNEGAKFVTKVEHHPKVAHWDEKEKPLELSESMAKDLAFGLMANFYLAYPVCAPIELDQQPYRYKEGHFKWVWNEAKEGESNDNTERENSETE